MSVKESIKVEVKEPLRSSKFDWRFPEEVRKHHGGEKLYLCYQCGSCAGGCPVGKITESYRPRHIIRMTLLGLRNDVLSSESIWLCASCYTCQERCPQGVEIADLMLAIRNVAANEGYVPRAFVDQSSIAKMLKTAAKKAGLEDLKIHQHSFRKLWITTAINDKANLYLEDKKRREDLEKEIGELKSHHTLTHRLVDPNKIGRFKHPDEVRVMNPQTKLVTFNNFNSN